MYVAPLNYDRYFKKVFSDDNIAKVFLQDFLDVTIESLEILPYQLRVTDDAAYVEFDFRCKIEDRYVIVDMQQWYKPDIVQRFYLYHALNSGLQLEDLPKKRVQFKSGKTIKSAKDYRKVEPVITLIWMVDESLNFTDNYVSYIMTPELVLDFLKNDRLWQYPEIKTLMAERNRLLEIAGNTTKHLDFLPQNRLIFAFQKNIVRNTHIEKYDRWFRFAETSKQSGNVEADFAEYREDEIFVEIIRRLERDALSQDDIDYIERERQAWEEVRRLERGFYEDGYEEGCEKGFKDGREEGREEGRETRDREIVLRNARKGRSIAEIADIVDIPEDVVERILREHQSSPKGGTQVCRTITPAIRLTP